MGAAALKIEPKKGEWLSKLQIAKRCGIDRLVCSNRLEDLGYEPDEERSTPKNQVYFFDDEMEFALKSAKDTTSAMKIRDLRVSAQTKEFKLAVMRKEYVETGEMVALFQAAVSHIYQELTVRQGKRIDSKLAKAKNVMEVKKIRNADNSRIMKELRANFEKYLG